MKTNWWKWGALTVIAAALFFWGFKCGGDNVKAVVHKDTVRVTVDSGYEAVVIDTHYVPKPYKVVVKAEPNRLDTTIFISPGPYLEINRRQWRRVYYFKADTCRLDTSEVMRFDDPYNPPVDWEGSGTAYYSDTIPIDHGTAVINDSVSQNRITGRSLKVSQRIPVIKETVTLFQPKRNIVYLGVNVQGGPQNYLFAAGADLSLKTKNDRIYSLGASLTRDNQVLYQGGVRFPIRLRIFDKR